MFVKLVLQFATNRRERFDFVAAVHGELVVDLLQAHYYFFVLARKYSNEPSSDA